MRLYYLDSFTRVMGVMICTELHGLRIQCKPDELSGFNPPEGQTRGAWASEFVSAFGGYPDGITPTVSPLVGRPLLLERTCSSR